MKIEPGGEELLRVAREALLTDLLPQLAEPSRYVARMIANAMAIAGRELAAGSPDDADPAAAAQLARDIRAGRFDGPQDRAALLERLRDRTRARLAMSNPRVLPPSSAQ